ncbi:MULTISPECIES: lasso peptide biosynthesis B2 protein [Kitasatospora]|uniref:lasso peptide biosynthesis B2 protein n=1 Tax=Kitasatospora TaxID=2063 RepID=UPI0002F46126|nr:lasso peptide biosynthesis B2 protein [Kitasatospora setae]
MVTALPSRVRLRPGERLVALASGLAAVWTTRGGRPDGRLHTVLNRALRGRLPPSTPEQAEHAVQAVTTAFLWLGGTTACLPRSVAAVLYCRFHGHAPTLVIGLRPGTADVHAWIEAAGEPAAEPFDPRPAYLPVTVYRQGAAL